jgi:RHS repeat-associated protein
VGSEYWDTWADLNGSNQLQTRYLHGDVVDQLFARIASRGTAAWYLTDRLGSVRNLVDASGAAQSHLDYDGFGKVTSESNPNFGDRWKWTGRERDGETGLQYNHDRYYDPAIGRWLSCDPIGFGAADTNLYRYVGNNPTSATDPSGLQEIFKPVTPGLNPAKPIPDEFLPIPPLLVPEELLPVSPQYIPPLQQFYGLDQEYRKRLHNQSAHTHAGDESRVAPLLFWARYEAPDDSLFRRED